MKSGIVADIYKNYVIVVSNSGEFLKLKKTGKVNIGDIYCERPYISSKRLSAAAAVIIAVAMSFSGLNAYAHQITGHVDLSENSKTIRLYYNRMGQIEKSDGFDISKIKNKTVKDAVKSISSEMEKKNQNVNKKPDVSNENSNEQDIKNTPSKKNDNNQNKNTNSSTNNKNKSNTQNNKNSVNNSNTKSQSSKDNTGSNAANSNNGSESNGSTKGNANSNKDNSSQNTHDNKAKVKK